jgi:protein-L-isoaspartate(D-aspartate) O-methyltransferase
MRAEAADYARERAAMVETIRAYAREGGGLLDAGGISEKVLEAMARTPRHLFVPEQHRSLAYRDGPVPIGHNQTISQPLIVATMAEAAMIGPADKVLEIGTGSGYAAAVLGRMAAAVWTIERQATLAETARDRLSRLGADNVHVHLGDGTLGLPGEAPFDAIIVAAAFPRVPGALADQLAEDGVLVQPLGWGGDELVTRFSKRSGGLAREGFVTGAHFVRLRGRYGFAEDP